MITRSSCSRLMMAALLAAQGFGIPAAMVSPPATATPVTGDAARAAFDRLKALSGSWKAHSTRGWEETGHYKVIAGGSAVMHTSFGAHPNETMITLYTLDQDRLLLTHYCVAGNQPRLVATRISGSGDEVEFTFLDGGNLPSRDQGHMDRVVLRFLDENRTTSRWTWYQNGEEKWLEEIEAHRAVEAASPTAPSSAEQPQTRP